MGKQAVEGQTIIYVSPAAPLARSVQGKKVGDVVMFNGAQIVIEEIY